VTIVAESRLACPGDFLTLCERAPPPAPAVTKRPRSVARGTRMPPLRRLERALVAVCGVAALFHPVDAALAAAVFVAALELMRIM